MAPGRELARGRALEPRRSCAGKLSRCDEKVFERDEGRSEKRREGLPLSPELPVVFFLENPKDVRRLESVLCLGCDVVATLSLDMGPAIEVGG
jgi:hypothetical protein